MFLNPMEEAVIEDMEETIGNPLVGYEEDPQDTILGLPWMGYKMRGYAVQGGNVTRLWLANQNLTELPSPIQELRVLHELVLPSNHLTTFPDDLCDLPDLEILDLNCNQLTALPETIGNLQSLKILGAGNNKISELPTTLGKLRKLRGVYLQGNQITRLPKEIGYLPELKVIHLESNLLWNLPEWLNNLNAAVTTSGNFIFSSAPIYRICVSPSIAGAQIKGTVAYEVTQLPSFRDTNFKAMHHIINAGTVPLNTIHFQQVIPEHFSLPDPTRILCYLGRGTNQKLYLLSDRQVKFDGRILQIRLQDLSRNATIGGFQPGDVIFFTVPVTAVKPDLKVVFTSEIVYQAHTEKGRNPLVCQPEPIQIPVMNVRRRYDKSKEIRNLVGEGAYEIVLFLKDTGQFNLENITVCDKVPFNFQHFDLTIEPTITSNETEDILTWQVNELTPGQKWEVHFKISGEGEFRAQEAKFVFK